MSMVKVIFMLERIFIRYHFVSFYLFISLFVILGSIVVADNVLSFGQPLHKYLHHVRDESASGLYSHSELHKCYLEYSTFKDYCQDDEKQEEKDEEVEIGGAKKVGMRVAKGTKTESYVGITTEGNESETDGIEISIFR